MAINLMWPPVVLKWLSVRFIHGPYMNLSCRKGKIEISFKYLKSLLNADSSQRQTQCDMY